MKVLLLNQTFYPDVVATAQYLTDLALHLARSGHTVEVITSRRGYSDPRLMFPAAECRLAIRIHRVQGTGFGKSTKWGRALDFLTFLLGVCFRLPRVGKVQATVALTSPPLLSLLGVLYSTARRIPFIYWVMDLNPDAAFAAGWLSPTSASGRMLEALHRFTLRRAAKIIVLDRFMRDRLLQKGVHPGKIIVLPLWALDSDVHSSREGRNNFRDEHRIREKCVVMLSGNFSPVHPLDTLLSAAKLMEQNSDIVFCFVGGGTEWARFRAEGVGGNIRLLPYQTLEKLSASLSAADIQVVVMGDAMLGLAHPCKIYNLLRVGVPVLYIGPVPSHITELLIRGSLPWAAVQHGDVAGAVREIKRLRAACPPQAALSSGSEPWSKDVALPQLAKVVESVVSVNE